MSTTVPTSPHPPPPLSFVLDRVFCRNPQWEAGVCPLGLTSSSVSGVEKGPISWPPPGAAPGLSMPLVLGVFRCGAPWAHRRATHPCPAWPACFLLLPRHRADQRGRCIRRCLAGEREGHFPFSWAPDTARGSTGGHALGMGGWEHHLPQEDAGGKGQGLLAPALACMKGL